MLHPRRLFQHISFVITSRGCRVFIATASRLRYGKLGAFEQYRRLLQAFRVGDTANKDYTDDAAGSGPGIRVPGAVSEVSE